MPYTFHLIPHTHWDREWYLPRGRFGTRLVRMIDELVALAPLGKREEVYEEDPKVVGDDVQRSERRSRQPLLDVAQKTL